MNVKIIFKKDLKLNNQKCGGLMRILSKKDYIIYINKDISIIEQITALVHEFVHVAVNVCLKEEMLNIDKEEEICNKVDAYFEKEFKEMLEK